MTQDQENLRRSRSALMAELEFRGAKFKGRQCTCPFHDDKNPSAGVYEEHGVWRFKCQACGQGGDIFDVRALVGGRPLAEVLKEVGPPPPPTESLIYPTLGMMTNAVANLAAHYVYTNPETNEPDLVVMRVEREGRKRYLQARPERGGFVMKAPTGLLPLYNRARVLKADEVVVVEGEKCVHALHDVGVVATTSPGGAGKAHLADWTPLRGKTVYLWPDADLPDQTYPEGKGVAHMRDVQKTLETIDCRVRWVDITPLNLPPKGDCVDYLATNGGSREDRRVAVRLVLEESSETGIAKGVGERYEQMISGAWKTIEWPWRQLTHLSKSLMPATVTTMPGEAGSSKSFALLEAMLYWHLSGYRTALFELEEDRTYHLMRALAQLAGNSHLTDDSWVREHSDETREALAEQKDLLETFGRTLWEAPDRMVTLDELARWVEQRCAEGCELVGIDPVTAAAVGREPWIDDQRFLFSVKTTLRRYGARLVLVTHPRKDRGKGKGTGLNDMAGGAAYERFSQSVLWLKRHDKKHQATILRDGHRRTVQFDRTLRIGKARNGPGPGLELAFAFDPATLRFAEQGIIIGDEVEIQSEVYTEQVSWK